MRAALLLFLLAPLLLGQAKPKLVPDVSETDIRIVYSFTGAELLLFGAILYPGGRLPRDRARTDIVVVVKGPTESILIREKRRVAGIWVNAEDQRYRSAPSFYAVASSRPIDRIVDATRAAAQRSGVEPTTEGGSSAPSADATAHLDDEFADLPATEVCDDLAFDGDDIVTITGDGEQDLASFRRTWTLGVLEGGWPARLADHCAGLMLRTAQHIQGVGSSAGPPPLPG